MSTDDRNSGPPIQRLDLAAVLASPRTAQYLLGTLFGAVLVTVLPLAVLGPGAGEAARRVTAAAVPLIVLYLLLGAALTACMVRRFGSVQRKTRLEPMPRSGKNDLTICTSEPYDPDVAVKALRSLGFRRIRVLDDRVWAVKNRWSPYGTLLLHFSMLLLLAGAALSAIPGHNVMAHMEALEGESAHSEGRIESLTLSSLTAERDATGALIALRGKVTNKAGRTFTVRPDLPAIVNPMTVVMLEDQDLAASFTLSALDGSGRGVTITEPLRIVAEGAHDTIVIKAERLGRYRLVLRTASNISGGVVGSLERYENGGWWKLIAEERTYTPGQTLWLDGAQLRFNGLSEYAILRAHRSLAAPIIGLGLLAAVLGTVLRLMLPRTDATVLAEADGCAVTVHEDVYRESRAKSALLARRLHQGL